MGSGASKGVAKAVEIASQRDLQTFFGSLPTEGRQKIAAALSTVEDNEQIHGDPEPGRNTRFLGKPYQDTMGTSFSDLLRRECLAVVKARYFEKQFQDGLPFQDRANIPPDCFFSGEEVIDYWMSYGAMFLVIISYGWLSKAHPDPSGFHLQRLVRVLKELKAFHRICAECGGSTPEECGVILDFCSLWQKHRVDDRTEFQLQQFKDGLKEINTPYGHQEITSVKLTAVPSTETRTYFNRGWTLFEAVLIDGKAPSAVLAKVHPRWGKYNCITLGDDFDPDAEAENASEFVGHFSTAFRHPPLSPKDFGKEMKARKTRAEELGVSLFTNGNDQPFVMEKYEKAFHQLTAAEQFSFHYLSWGPAEMAYLAEVLKSCQALKVLSLSGNQLGPKGAETLAAVLPNLTSLQELRLGDTGIGDAGAESLATALPSLTALQRLHLMDNGIGDAGIDKLATVFPSLTNLQYLRLDSNGIGEAGADKLATVLPRLKDMQELSLADNMFSEAATKHLEEAVVTGCQVSF